MAELGASENKCLWVEELYSLFLHLRHYSKSNSPKYPDPIGPPQYIYTVRVNEWGVCNFLIAFPGEAQKGIIFI